MWKTDAASKIRFFEPETLKTKKNATQSGTGRAIPSSPQRLNGADRHSLLEALFNAHGNELKHTLRRLFGDGPPDPEDLVQSAFSQIANLKSDHPIENPKAYLFKVAINLGRRSVKHIASTRTFMETQAAFVGEEVEEISPERLLVSREEISTLDRALKALSPRQREIIVRSRLKGETYAQITAATGWSAPVISRELNAALKTLEASLDRNVTGWDAPS